MKMLNEVVNNKNYNRRLLSGNHFNPYDLTLQGEEIRRWYDSGRVSEPPLGMVFSLYFREANLVVWTPTDGLSQSDFIDMYPQFSSRYSVSRVNGVGPHMMTTPNGSLTWVRWNR